MTDRPQPRFHYGKMPANFTSSSACHRRFHIGGGPTTGLNRFGYFEDEACRPHRMWPDHTRVEVTRIAQRAFDPYPKICLLYTSPSPRDGLLSRMPSSA